MPKEEVVVLEQPDPTWAAEYAHFKALVTSKKTTDLSDDFWLQQTLRSLSSSIAKQKIAV
jgi:hypothetical protein